MIWKKHRGKLGILYPLLGEWITNAESTDYTSPKCTRTFQKTLGDKYVQLEVKWFLENKIYEDRTLFGLNSSKEICFWSFTSDGKNSTGKLADVSDIHPEAIGFEAEMPAGIARQAYWPSEDGGFYWVVESKNKKGWKRFVHQHFTSQK